MALSNYTELQAALADLLHREDLTSQIVDFITLLESELNVDMRMRLMESDESVTLTEGTRTIALPSRYLEPISLELVISGEQNTPLHYLHPAQLPVNESSGAAGRPQYWTVNGANIEVPYLADDTYTMTFRMLKGFDLASTSTNALLTKYPGLYLYGAALQAATWMKDDQRIPLWQSYYDRIKDKANRAEARTKALSTLSTDLPMSRRSNILTGD